MLWFTAGISQPYLFLFGMIPVEHYHQLWIKILDEEETHFATVFDRYGWADGQIVSDQHKEHARSTCKSSRKQARWCETTVSRNLHRNWTYARSKRETHETSKSKRETYFPSPCVFLPVLLGFKIKAVYHVCTSSPPTHCCFLGSYIGIVQIWSVKIWGLKVCRVDNASCISM